MYNVTPAVVSTFDPYVNQETTKFRLLEVKVHQKAVELLIEQNSRLDPCISAYLIDSSSQTAKPSLHLLVVGGRRSDAPLPRIAKKGRMIRCAPASKIGVMIAHDLLGPEKDIKLYKVAEAEYARRNSISDNAQMCQQRIELLTVNSY